MRNLLLALIALAGLTIPAHGDGPLALGGLDPVLLISGQKAAGTEEHSFEYQGFTYRFRSAESRATFTDEPERFAMQGRGYCAVMPQARARGDLFTVHEGRIYGFGSTSCREKFLAQPARYLEDRPARKVAILVFEGVELLDFAGPGEVFDAASSGRAFEVFTVAPSAEPITSQRFVTVTPTYALADSPKPDVLVVPGGNVSSLLRNEAAMAWIEERAAQAEVVLSVCNGALVLARAGLLDGLEATTHAGTLETLRAWAPKTVVHEGRRFVDNGKIVTSAGVSAGIDASLHLVSRLIGPDDARATATYMEYAWTGPQPAETTAPAVAAASTR